jgi:two-component system, OmpR family, phosphate regulon sensor histidine kinase PhoR
MDRSSVSFGRLAAMVAILILPVWGAFGTLVSLDLLPLPAALACAFVLLLVMSATVYYALYEGHQVMRWARTLAQGATLNALKPRESTISTDSVAAVGVIWRAWQRERENLLRSLEWHDALFTALPDPLILLGAGRRITNINTATNLTFGRETIGRDLSVVLRAPEILEAADDVLTGAQAREIEFTLPVPIEKTYLAKVFRLNMEAEDGTKAVLTLHDITSVRRVEQMRADFVANASHELRTPLATLLGFIETLRGPARDDTEARDRFLAIMQDQASRMARLVQDLLSLSRIELNEHSRPQDRLNLSDIVSSAIEAMHPIAISRSMILETAIEDQIGQIMGQEDELIQVIQNLLDNALKYGREGTTVTVEVKSVTRLPVQASHLAGGKNVVITVTDRGEGIPRAHLPRLTERFYRVDPARSRSLGGTGLGLAIVKHIVNRHRGTLTVDSVLGQGSVFSVYFPLIAEM